MYSFLGLLGLTESLRFQASICLSIRRFSFSTFHILAFSELFSSLTWLMTHLKLQFLSQMMFCATMFRQRLTLEWKMLWLEQIYSLSSFLFLTLRSSCFCFALNYLLLCRKISKGLLFIFSIYYIIQDFPPTALQRSIHLRLLLIIQQRNYAKKVFCCCYYYQLSPILLRLDHNPFHELR